MRNNWAVGCGAALMTAVVLCGAGCATSAEGPLKGDELACQVIFDPALTEDADAEQMGAKFLEHAGEAKDTELAYALTESATAVKTGDAEGAQYHLMLVGMRCAELGYGVDADDSLSNQSE